MTWKHSPTRALTRAAFTLIELATVVVVLAVISAMAVPRFGDFIVSQRLEAASRRILVDLALAQRDARFTGTSRTVTFTPADDRYRLWSMASLDDPNADYIVLLANEPYGVDVVSAMFGGNLDVIFDAYGVPDSGGTIVIALGGRQKTISVDAGSGRATVLAILAQ